MFCWCIRIFNFDLYLWFVVLHWGINKYLLSSKTQVTVAIERLCCVYWMRCDTTMKLLCEAFCTNYVLNILKSVERWWKISIKWQAEQSTMLWKFLKILITLSITFLYSYSNLSLNISLNCNLTVHCKNFVVIFTLINKLNLYS